MRVSQAPDGPRGSRLRCDMQRAAPLGGTRCGSAAVCAVRSTSCSSAPVLRCARNVARITKSSVEARVASPVRTSRHERRHASPSRVQRIRVARSRTSCGSPDSPLHRKRAIRIHRDNRPVGSRRRPPALRRHRQAEAHRTDAADELDAAIAGVRAVAVCRPARGAKRTHAVRASSDSLSSGSSQTNSAQTMDVLADASLRPTLTGLAR